MQRLLSCPHRVGLVVTGVGGGSWGELGDAPPALAAWPRGAVAGAAGSSTRERAPSPQQGPRALWMAARHADPSMMGADAVAFGGSVSSRWAAFS